MLLCVCVQVCTLYVLFNVYCIFLYIHSVCVRWDYMLRSVGPPERVCVMGLRSVGPLVFCAYVLFHMHVDTGMCLYCLIVLTAAPFPMGHIWNAVNTGEITS